MEVYSSDTALLRGTVAPDISVYRSSIVLVLACAGYWWKRPAAADDGTLVKLTSLCDRMLAIYYSVCNWLYCEFEIDFFPAAEENQGVHGSNEVVGLELSRQQSRTELVINGVSIIQNILDVIFGRAVSHFRGDTPPSSDSSGHCPKFFTTSPSPLDSCIQNPSHSSSLIQKVPGRQSDCDLAVTEDSKQTVSKEEKTDSSDSTVRASEATFHLSLGRQQSINNVHEPNNEVDKTPSECAGHGQDETLGGVKSEQFVSQAGSKVANDTTNGTGSGVSSGIKDSPSRSEHTNTSVKNRPSASEANVVNKTQNSKAVGVPTSVNISPSLLGPTNTSGICSQASGSSASTMQSGADCGSRSNPKGVPPRVQAGDSEVPPGAEGVARRTGPEVRHPVQESGLQCSSDLVLTVPVIPRRTGLVLGSDWKWKQRLTSESGNSKASRSPKSPRVTEGATATNPTVTAVGQPCSQKLIKPSKAGDQTGCIVYSSIAAFEAGSFLPLPSREAVERSIGKGGNGTISIVYFKGAEFAVKRTHFRQVEVEILASLSHDNILPLQAVMMGEEDPQRPSRHLCYHFMPRMSGDLQSYLTKVGHGALSNLLMQHKEKPTMLQLVVDNTKHILRSTLKALAYLHRNNIVHNDVKPSNFLTSTQCGCQSPLICDHGQQFAVKLADFDSALEVTKVQIRHSVLRQLYRNNPIGTPGYRPPEYVLVATRTPDELDAGTLTAADVWGFGCSVLKIFLSHSGPHTQKQMSFLNLWERGGPPWEVEGERAREELKLALLERVYPNWPQLWAFVSDCLKVSPKDRMTSSKLIGHSFFTS